MGKLVFQLTGAFAEFERTMIRQRIKAGLKRAVAQGVKLGRPKIDGAGGEGSGDHRFDLAVCAGYLIGCQGVLTPPSIALSPPVAKAHPSDSEQFRPVPRTCQGLGGRLMMR